MATSAAVTITAVYGSNGQSLPVTGNSLGPGYSATVKQERHDEAEIAELAAKMLETQKAAMAKQQQTAQMQNRSIPGNQQPTMPNGQANILNYLTRAKGTTPTPTSNGQSNGSKTNGSATGSDGEKKPCDEESQKGHFGWSTFGKTYIPYIYRQTEKYCAVRMVEFKLLGKYLNCLHPDIYSSCTCVRSYYITEAESRLFNEINHKHCDAEFGRDLFTLKDLVVRLSDATKFFQFLDICYRKLISGSKTPSEKCGFIRINKESVVPYTVRNNEQVVPLFYFEGETENLKQKADYLSGWDLAYLKFCCKVQGIRNELFSSESVAVISLTDIKSYFPNGTEFEDYWPSKVVDSNLLLGPQRSGPNNSVNWTRQPTAPPPKINPPAAVSNKSQQQQQQQQQQQSQQMAAKRGAAYQMAANSAANAQRLHAATLAAASQATVQALNGAWMAQPQNSLSMIQAQMLASQAQQQNHPAVRPNYRGPAENLMRQQQYTYNNGSISMQPVNNHGQGNAPPPLVRAGGQSASHQMSSLQAATAYLQQQQQVAAQQHHQRTQQQQQQQQQQNGRSGQANGGGNSATMHLQRHAAAVQQGAVVGIDPSNRLHIIPEIASGNVHIPPYKVQKVYVDNQTVPCINMQAYTDSDQLMTLTDFRESFFPNVPLEHCKRLIEALGVELYKGNRRQIQVLLESGRSQSENIPLVKVRDVKKYMPQLTFMIRNQEQPHSKRPRVS
ncbi:uncharacterized protein LOC129919406 isoform X1 [Episyrphus balteatus]|uniref:uncharacterized protein LOC129919406 isoform X1 n=1 Tax=Episyrphus balteatus TaxID=286459 RepID=UPI002484E524|nr:uncharacterized protein LOC129919406 isoform X1 [Episyrphus balteatus]